ncbi:MAG: hypothetical protein ABEH40_09730 [Haloferacaceae archaeon]
MTYADSILGAVYEGLVDPGKGLAAAKRDYWYERYVSGLEERGVDEVDLELTFPDPETINPFFYLPRFHVQLSPHRSEFDDGPADPGASGAWRRIANRLLPPGLDAIRRLWVSEILEVPIHGNKPKSAYENASELYERWLRDLESRGFTVHRDYEFPRGLQDAIEEGDRQPW